jgi:hypothetical protein
MSEPIRLVGERDVAAGLRRIRRWRWLLLVVVLLGGVVVVLSRSLVPAMLLWLLAPNIVWFILTWSRCPRCDEFFFTGFALSPLFGRRCQNCGLKLRGESLPPA